MSQEKVKPLTVCYRRHEESQTPRMRVWRSDWSPDTFNVMTFGDFLAFKAQAELFIPFVNADEEEVD